MYPPLAWGTSTRPNPFVLTPAAFRERHLTDDLHTDCAASSVPERRQSKPRSGSHVCPSLVPVAMWQARGLFAGWDWISCFVHARSPANYCRCTEKTQMMHTQGGPFIVRVSPLLQAKKHKWTKNSGATTKQS